MIYVLPYNINPHRHNKFTQDDFEDAMPTI